MHLIGIWLLSSDSGLSFSFFDRFISANSQTFLFAETGVLHLVRSNEKSTEESSAANIQGIWLTSCY